MRTRTWNLGPTPGDGLVMHIDDIDTTDDSGNPQSVFVAACTIYYWVMIVDQLGVSKGTCTINVANVSKSLATYNRNANVEISTTFTLQ